MDRAVRDDRPILMHHEDPIRAIESPLHDVIVFAGMGQAQGAGPEVA